MTTLLFTDTHFGWKNNSMSWLNSQLDFIYKEFIPTIQKYKKIDTVRVVHLGDVFDSRSTISTYVATKVIQAFIDIRKYCDEFVIVCGNHDFYSPNSDEVDSVNLFLNKTNITIVNKEILTIDNNCFIPWYKWEDVLNENIILHGVDNIFVHSDIFHDKLPQYLKHKNIYSGHIHIPQIKNNLYNLGSCYSLNFADANQERGFYVIQNNKCEFITNNTSIKFYRIYGDKVLNLNDIEEENYIELYVKESDLLKQEYIDAIKQYNEKYKHLWIIPILETNNNVDNIEFSKYDITTLIDNLITEDLLDYYKQVKQKLNI